MLLSAESEGDKAGSGRASNDQGSSYFAAAVVVSMAAWQLGCRDGVLDPILEGTHYKEMPLSVALESLSKVCNIIICF